MTRATGNPWVDVAAARLVCASPSLFPKVLTPHPWRTDRRGRKKPYGTTTTLPHSPNLRSAGRPGSATTIPPLSAKCPGGTDSVPDKLQGFFEHACALAPVV